VCRHGTGNGSVPGAGEHAANHKGLGAVSAWISGISTLTQGYGIHLGLPLRSGSGCVSQHALFDHGLSADLRAGGKSPQSWDSPGGNI